jgi:hypothetical protein
VGLYRAVLWCERGIIEDFLTNVASSGISSAILPLHAARTRSPSVRSYLSPLHVWFVQIPTEAKLAFFNEVRHAYGRTALL